MHSNDTAPMATGEDEEDFTKIMKITTVMQGNEANGHHDITNAGLSLENLVQSFNNTVENTLNKNFSSDLPKEDHLQMSSTRHYEACEMLWSSLSRSQTQKDPIDWSRSRIRQELKETGLELPDEEEIRRAFDLHSMVTPLLPDCPDPVQTANQIINEIELMMDEEDEELGLVSSSSGYNPSDESTTGLCTIAKQELFQHRQNYPQDWNLKLGHLSVAALAEYCEEMEAQVRVNSLLLVRELDRREELQYARETEERFVSLLTRVQKLRRSVRAAEGRCGPGLGAGTPSGPPAAVLRSRGRLGRQPRPHSFATTADCLESIGGGCAGATAGAAVDKINNNNDDNFPAARSAAVTADRETAALNTIIPYHIHERCVTPERLNIYNQLLQSMLDDNSQLPTLLADYILNVYAPAEVSAPTLSL